MIETAFWQPQITSQTNVCPCPFYVDTYKGCVYGCAFCFSRVLTEFNRRHNECKKFSHLVGNNANEFAKWCEKSLSAGSESAARVAFKERIPLKIGAMSDPCPPVENSQHITRDFLRVLKQYDYPTQVTTKNPEVLLNFADEIVGSNFVCCVSISFFDDDIARKVEKCAISTTRRLKAIKSLSSLGIKCFVRHQPFIYPYSYDNAEKIVSMIKDSGAFGFNTEGIKVRTFMPPQEKEAYSDVGKAFGFDLFEHMKGFGQVCNNERVYKPVIKERVLDKFTQLARQYELEFHNADNYVNKRFGCGFECCGTSALHGYKLLKNNIRVKCFPEIEREWCECIDTSAMKRWNKIEGIKRIRSNNLEVENNELF